MGIRDFYNQDEYIEETESVPDNVSIGKDPLSVSTQIVSGWSQNPYNTTPGGTTYDSEPAFSPVIGPVTYVDIEVVEETIVTDYDSTTLQILAEDGAIFYAIMKDGTEVEVDWTEIQPIPETIREETINLVEDIINAPEQFFWNDQQGVHVAEEDRASWESSVEDNFSDYNATTKPHHNMLMNSQGFLFRKALNNLSVMTSSSVAFYDGQGNTSEHIRALFGAQMAQIGKSGSDHIIIDTQGVTAYKGDGSLHEIVGIIDGAHLKNSTITGSKIASSTIENSNIKDGTITGAKIQDSAITGSKIASSTIENSNIKDGTITGSKIQGSTLTDIPYAEIDELKTRNISASSIEAATGFVSTLASNSINATKIVANQGIIDNLETNFAHITNGVIDNANINVANVNGLSANYAHITNGVIDNAKIGHADVNGLSANYAHIVGGVIDNAKIGHADVDGLSTNYAHIEDGVIENAHINVANVDDILANYAHIQNGVIDNAKIGHADVNGLSANYAHITNGTIDNAKIGHADVTGLSANYATITNLNAATGRIDDLEADHVSTSDLAAETARINTLVANTADLNTIRANAAKVTNLTAAELEADHATVGSLDTNYAQIDMANVNNAWIQNGTIKDAAISDGMINSVSANKLTAGTIDASNITVTNLNADNITTGTINGQRIGQGSLSLDKLSEDVYTEAEVDAKLSTMQSQIDGAIETWTGTTVPTLQNSPASSWNTTFLKDSHVGDVYFVVNPQSQQNGYNYRFTKSGSTYSWQLIKDSDVTNALQRLTTAEGKITAFDSDISQLKTDAGTLTTKTTSLETRMSDAEADILDKVDITTFNEVSDTVDSHSQSITQMTTTLSNKADSSTVSSLTTRVSKNEQDISGINSKIGSLESTIETKADGSTVETVSSNLNTLTQTVNGHTQSISSIQNTQTSIQGNAIKSTVQLWFTKANTTAPNKPTAHVATNDATSSNVWNLAVPNYNASYPNYFYCYEYEFLNGTYGWSAVTRDIATGETQERARTAISNASTADSKAVAAQNTANKNIKESVQLWCTRGSSAVPDKPTSAVTSNSTAGNSWTTKVPSYNTSYPHYFYCMQYKLADGTYEWSDVVYDQATTEAQSVARTTSSNLSTVTTKVNNISDTVDGHTSQLSATTTSLTTLRTDFDNLEIGGRNLALNTAGVIVDRTELPEGSNRAEYFSFDLGRALPFEAGTPIVISFDLYMPIKSSSPRFLVYNTNEKGPHWVLYNVEVFSGKNLTVGSIVDERIVIKTFIASDRSDATSPHDYLEFYSNYGSNNYYRISNLKLEKGTKPTDWTPAPEDLEEYATTAATTAANAVPRMTKINAPQKTFTTALWKMYGTYGRVENWTTGSSYDNSHIRVGDRAYVTGTISDQMHGSATIIGKVTSVVPAGSGSSSVQMQSEQLIFGGDAVSAIQTSLSETQTDYATFKQTTQNFESTIGSTYATKEELTTTVEQATQQYVDVEAEPFIIDDDGISAPLRSVEANGWSEQFSTTGKNLLPPSSVITGKGITGTMLPDGGIVANGTATEDIRLWFLEHNSSGYDEFIGTFTLSVESAALPAGAYFAYTDGSGGHGFSTKSITVTFDSSNKLRNFYISFPSGTVLSNFVMKPQIELGSTATTYEPYTGGAPSPSPDYPQEIKVARGRNLIDISTAYDASTFSLSNGVLSNSQTDTRTPAQLWLQFLSGSTQLSTTAFYSLSTDLVVASAKIPSGTERIRIKHNGAYRDLYIIRVSMAALGLSDGDYITASFNVIANNPSVVGGLVVSQVQLTLGSTPQPYIPYGHVGLEVQGKNLFNPLYLLTASGWTESNGVYTGTSVDLYRAFNNGYPALMFEQGAKYTFSLDFDYSGDTGIAVSFEFIYTDGTNSTAYFNLKNHHYTVVSTSGKTVSKLNLSYGTNRTVRMSNIQLELGSTATEYEPYYHTTTPIPLPERGWVGSLPDGTADAFTLDWAGKCEWEKLLAKHVLSEFTEWEVYSAPNSHIFRTKTNSITDDYVALSESGTKPHNSLSTAYIAKSWTPLSASDNGYYGVSYVSSSLLCSFIDASSSSVPEFLNNNADVEWLYPLATPVIEQCGYINMPEVYPGCTISIPELDEVSISYWTPASKSLVDNTRLLEERVSNAETSIDQNKDQIALRAKSSDVYTKTETDGLISTEVSNRNAAIQLSADGINTTISALSTTVNSKADSSTVNTMSSKLNTVSDTVDGHTQSISNITSTQTTMQSKLDKTIVETTQLWFSKADTTAPNKPTAQVTSTSTAGNAWSVVVPAYNASYPNYYYCYQWKYSDGTYGWSAVTRDIATGESQERARTAITNAAAADTKAGNAVSTANTAKSTADTANDNASTALSTANTAASDASEAKADAATAISTANTADSNASTALSTANTASSNASTAVSTANTAKSTADKNVKESQQLWFTKSDSSAPAKPTVKVTSTAVTGNAWTTKVPTYNASYPHYFYCMQYIAADGTVTWSDVVYDQATTEAQSVARTTSANLSTLQQDYTTFKQTTQQFESTVGTTYATKTELQTTDDKIENLESRVSNAETSITQTNNQIALKANASDVYTKTQTDGLISTEVSNRNSAINQKADAITASVASTYTTKTEFNNLEIGGRNLIYHSDSFKVGSVGQNSNMTQSVDENGYYKIVLVNMASVYNAWNAGWYATQNVPFGPTHQAEIALSEGDSFTISFIIRAEGCTKKPRVYIKSGMGYYSMQGSVSEDWSTIWYTGTWKDAETITPHLLWSNVDVDSTYWIRAWKLEKGNKPTDWTPAPEDLEAYTDFQINSAKSEIKVTTDNITSEVSKISSAKYLTTSYSFQLSAIKTYAAEGYTDNWQTTDAVSKGVRVGDNVYLKMTDLTRNCSIYIKATVTELVTGNYIKCVSHGYEDVLPVETIKSTINQSSDSVKIQAKHVEIDGAAIFSNSNFRAAADAAYDTKGSAAAVQTNLDNLEIGGRNLLQNTEWNSNSISLFVRKSGYALGSCVGVWCREEAASVAMTDDGYLQVSTDHPSTRYGIIQDVYLEKGIYTLSAKSGPNAFRIAFGSITWPDNILTIEQPYTRDYFVIEVPSDAMYRAYIYGHNTTTITAPTGNYLKLEKGNRATDWTPAPEDVDASIGTAKTEAINSANSNTDTKLQSYSTTTQMNSAIGTAKTEAINSAALDATSKANAAEQNAKDAIPTDISELNNDTGFITSDAVPTKVSDLTNDSGFQTSNQVNTAITSKGYQTSSQVESAITSKGYATTTQAQGYADTAESNAKTYAEGQVSTVNSALESYKSITNSTLTSLQNQVDGQIEAWYKTVDPTSSNEPASTWNTNELKARHEGDLYYNVNNGHSWRWLNNGGTYSWQQIPDSDAAAALAAAQNAQTSANTKRRIFTTTPTVPYDVGDLWVNGTQIKYANVSRSSTQSYTASDWVLTATDDSNIPTNVSELTNDANYGTTSQIATAKTEAISSANSNTDTKLQSYSTTTQMNSAIGTAKTEAINSANSNTDTKLQSYSTTTQMNSAIGTAKTEAINASYANYGYKYHKDIVIYGDSDKYYPVYFDNDQRDYTQNVPHDLFIRRSWGEQAPSDWNTSSDLGTLILRVRWNYGGWGGATYNVQVCEWSEKYVTMVGDVLVGNKSGMNSTIYLRGGGTTGALYHLYSDVAFDTTRYGATFPYIGTTTPGTVYMQSGTYTWTVDNPLTTPNKTHILSLAAVLEEQYIYISKPFGTNSVASTDTWITANSDSQNTWTIKRPTYNASYPVLFVAKQKKTTTGHIICTTPVKDDTTTIIDGGHIITGTIDASRVTVTNLDASKITTGSLSADRIKANVIDAVNNGTGTINADKINVSALSIGYSQLTGTPTIPTKVSQLTNDSSYATTTQLPTKVSQLTNDSSYATTTQLPTKVSQLTNDSSYATTNQLPTKVSQLTNDSSYATTTQLSTKSDKTHPDTRNDNQPPSWYFTNYPRQTIKEFKYANKIGIGSSSVYCTLETTVPWSDSSGGYPTQTTIVNKVRYSRVGTGASTWSPWVTDNTSVVVSCTSIDYSNNTASLKALLYIDGVATSTNVTYQWLKDGTAISGATSQTLAVTSAMGLDHVYSCTVTY